MYKIGIIIQKGPERIKEEEGEGNPLRGFLSPRPYLPEQNLSSRSALSPGKENPGALSPEKAIPLLDRLFYRSLKRKAA